MRRLTLLSVISLAAATSGRADLNTLPIFTGNVGLSVDAIGGLDDPVGNIRADLPASATVLAAYLYSAGTPSPYYPDSPTTLSQYNGAGITLGGVPINNFSALVGATSSRPDIGQWYTARADVTSVVNSLRNSGLSWSVSEGSLNGRIDGELLAVVYSDASRPQGSVVLLDGGQQTGGETKTLTFGAPLDPNAPDFQADMALGISFSTGDNQRNVVSVNGKLLTSSAGGNDDGLSLADGSLITAGGIGDSNANPDPTSTDTSNDDELYSLKDFIKPGDTSTTLSIATQNASNDDNLFFLGLQFSAEVTRVVGAPDGGSTLPLLGAGIASLSLIAKRKSRG